MAHAASDSTVSQFVASARRFRPQRFDQVLGQPHVVRALRGALNLNRIAAAYLFSGPRGVGKTTVARLIAKAINCVQRDGVEPCGQCPACRSIQHGSCFDVHEIDAASNTGVDNMREVCDIVRIPPASVPNKVVIIDECHMLSKGAFNAFLKTLEEPPPNVVFILATTEVEKVPDTIKSRCQQYRFAPAQVAEVVTNLERVLDQRDDVTLDATARQQMLLHVARSADGSFRDALSLLDQLLSMIGPEGDAETALGMLGVTPWAMLSELVEAMAKGDAARALASLHGFLQEGVDLAQLVQHLAEFLRAVMILQLAPGQETMVPYRDEALVAIQQHAKQLTLDQALRAIDLCWAAAERFRHDADQRTVVEVALVKACYLKDLTPLPQLVDRLAALEGGRPAKSVGKRANPNIAVALPTGERAANAPLSLETLQARWRDVREQCPADEHELGQALTHARIEAVSAQSVRLSLPRGHALLDAGPARENAAATLQRVLGEMFDQAPAVSLVSRAEQDDNQTPAAAPRGDTRDHPAVADIVDMFDGTVIQRPD